MNFGSEPNAKTLSAAQQPTYHLAPNFTSRPFPDGPLDLGTVVEDLQSFYPINQGTSRIEIPSGQRYADIKEEVVSSATWSSGGEAGFLARVLDGSIGGDASLRGQRSEENVYKIERLETVYFCPSPGYIKQCMRLGEVNDYLEMANYGAPVYLITGLKIAWGATVETKRACEVSGTAGVDVRVPAGVVGDAQVRAHGAVSKTSGTTSSFGKPADFVLGIQVLKLYHKRGFLSLFGGKPSTSLTTERVVRGAVLVDNDSVPEDDDGDETFRITDIDQSDMEGCTLFKVEGVGESWSVPHKLLR